MSDIKKLIIETNKTTRKGRRINNILWFVVVLLVIVSLFVTYIAIDTKNELLVEKEKLKTTNEQLNQSNVALEETKSLLIERNKTLTIIEENLQGEKNKLEDISKKYDSLRQVQLETQNHDELWDYAVKENTVQSYTDYADIKGYSDEAISKIKTLLQNTGYVMIEESNGNVLIDEVGHGFWKPKSARSIRKGVIGVMDDSERNGDVILKGQVFVILQDSIMSGNTRWAKIAY